MKKIVLFIAAIGLLAACQQKGKPCAGNGDCCQAETVAEVNETYTGTLPAADGPGIDYELTLTAAAGGADTVYALNMTYIDAEGPGKHKTVKSEGRLQNVGTPTRKAYKLLPQDGEESMYFSVVNDSTLRLVDENLQEAGSGLNYDLTKRK